MSESSISLLSVQAEGESFSSSYDQSLSLYPEDFITVSIAVQNEKKKEKKERETSRVPLEFFRTSTGRGSSEEKSTEQNRTEND